MASAITGFVLTLVFIWALIPLASRLGLVADPGQHRWHEGSIPLVGGIAMMAGCGISILVFQLSIGFGILAAVGLLLMVGMLDDRFALPYLVRFLVQIVAVWIMIQVDGVRLVDLGKVFSPEIASLGRYSTALTIFAVVGVINAVNMVDGMDGLAGCMVLVCLMSCYVLLMLSGIADLAIIGLLVAVVAGFLVFNIPGSGGKKARTFMGDAGSMVLGLWIAWLLIYYSQGENRAFAPIIGLWVLMLPLFDAVGVLIRRLLRRGSPFRADRLHTHHLLLKSGFNVGQSLAIMVAVSAMTSFLGIVLYLVGVREHFLFYFFLSLFVCYILLMEWGEHKLSVINRDEADD